MTNHKLTHLLKSIHTVIESGEFASWAEDQTMPHTVSREFSELKEAYKMMIAELRVN